MGINYVIDNSLDNYEEYITKNKNTLFYHSKKYINFISEILNCEKKIMLAKDSNNKIIGTLPLLFMNGKYGHVYNSLPYFGSNGGIISDSKEATFLLINEFNKLSKLEDTASTTIIENPLSNIKYNGLNSNLYDERIGQFTMLPKKYESEEDLLNLLHGKTRNTIRKSNKSEIEFCIDNNALNFIKNIHNENMLRIGGLSKSNDFFDKIPERFQPNLDYKIYIAKYNNQKVAGLLLFYHKKIVEYFTPVIKSEFREKQPLSGLIFRAMLDAIKMDFKIWNWGGTWFSQEGVFKFKNRWGTSNMNYKYMTYLNNKNILNISKEELLEEYKNFYVCPFNKLKK